ncbi:MAG TPA: RNA methyltransferase [Rubrobacter sp.]|nr:RNA methyltransferase [Rubrobacter sp.]
MPGTPAISLKRAAKLKAKKHREVEHLFIAEGAASLEEAPTPPLQVFDQMEQLRRISTLQTPAGPAGVFPFLDVSAAELLSSVRRIILLHGVQDPGNVGTAIRSAHAFGAGVALSRGSADLYNPKTVRATMGSIFHTPVARELASADFLATAADAGFGLAAAVPAAGNNPENLPLGRLVICIGAEGSGLPEDVLGACEVRVRIPSLAPSLNASVAASILLYEAYSRVLT